MVKERLDPRFSYIDFPTLSIYTDKAAKWVCMLVTRLEFMRAKEWERKYIKINAM